MKEIWKDIKGYEDIYQVSNMGRIKSLERTIVSNSPRHKNGKRKISERILKGFVSNEGYRRINLAPDTNNKTLVHRVVAKTFCPNPLDYTHVNHKDCDKLNNKANNLEWCTNRQNVIHAVQNGRGGTSKLTPHEVTIIKFLLSYLSLSQKHISELFGVARKTINDINTNKTWAHLHKEATIEEVQRWMGKQKQRQIEMGLL